MRISFLYTSLTNCHLSDLVVNIALTQRHVEKTLIFRVKLISESTAHNLTACSCPWLEKGGGVLSLTTIVIFQWPGLDVYLWVVLCGWGEGGGSGTGSIFLDSALSAAVAVVLSGIMSSLVNHSKAQDIQPMLAQCWSTVCDAGPTLSQYWANPWYFLVWKYLKPKRSLKQQTESM